MLKNFFQFLWENRWESIFFTGKVDEYSRAKYKLTSNGIKVKTKIISNRERGGIGTIGVGGNEYYEIYVKAKDVEKANQAIS